MLRLRCTGCGAPVAVRREGGGEAGRGTPGGGTTTCGVPPPLYRVPPYRPPPGSSQPLHRNRGTATAASRLRHRNRSPEDVMSNGLLLILAHPDDESFM